MNKVSIIFFSLILSACGTTRGTSVDYVPLLSNIKSCDTKLDDSSFNLRNSGTLFFEIIGDDKRCLDTSNGQSFYKALTAKQPIKSVLIKSFYNTRGEAARVFLPVVYSYNIQNGEMKEAVVEYLDDLHNSNDGNYLEIKYFFDHPVSHVVVVSDFIAPEQSYDYNTRNIGGTYSGGMVIEWDFIQHYDIKVNAGGPLDIRLN